MKALAVFMGAAILCLCLGIFVLSIFYQLQNEIDWRAFSIIFICGFGLVVMGLAPRRGKSK